MSGGQASPIGRLIGHPEFGEETFSVEKDMATGRVIVALRSWSRPGTVLAMLCPPWVRRQQVRASTRRAHMAEMAKGGRAVRDPPMR